LRTHYATATVDALQAHFLQRTYTAIRRHAEDLWLPRPQRGRPKPRGTPWTEADKAVLRAYARGAISEAELCAQLPGRSWDAIEKQCQVLGLTKGIKPMYYRAISDTLEMIFGEDFSRIVSSTYNLPRVVDFAALAAIAARCRVRAPLVDIPRMPYINT
jgi:hypothetical protein